MKIQNLKQRLRQERPTDTVTLQLPEDVIADLKRVAPQRGFSDYIALLRTYIGQGLRADLERLDDNPQVADLIESLRRRGVAEDVIASAIAEAKNSREAA